MSITLCLVLLILPPLGNPVLDSPRIPSAIVIQEQGQEGLRESVRRSNAAFEEAIRLL